MTIEEINVLRWERKEIDYLLSDISFALALLDEGKFKQQVPCERFVSLGYGHTTLGNCLRFRGENTIADAPTKPTQNTKGKP